MAPMSARCAPASTSGGRGSGGSWTCPPSRRAWATTRSAWRRSRTGSSAPRCRSCARWVPLQHPLAQLPEQAGLDVQILLTSAIKRMTIHTQNISFCLRVTTGHGFALVGGAYSLSGWYLRAHIAAVTRAGSVRLGVPAFGHRPTQTVVHSARRLEELRGSWIYNPGRWLHR